MTDTCQGASSLTRELAARFIHAEGGNGVATNDHALDNRLLFLPGFRAFAVPVT